MSVNLSTHQLQEPDLVDDISHALDVSGLPPGALVLEVTESAIIENLDLALPRLHAIRSLGVGLAVDDFGTGYSSLSYLADLPVNFVKIDKSFIDRITPDAGGTTMAARRHRPQSRPGFHLYCRGRREREPARRPR